MRGRGTGSEGECEGGALGSRGTWTEYAGLGEIRWEYMAQDENWLS